MSASNQVGGGGGPQLEDQLRNMILSHSEGPSTRQTEDGNSHSRPRQPLGQVVAQPAQDTPASPSSPDHRAGQGPAKNQRKRPNQAQRRQMSAQLSIPIDTRPQSHESPQGPYAHANTPGHAGQYHGRGGHHRFQQPRSAGFRPPSRDNASQNGPLTGQPFPPRSRHQQSLSYHGPTSTPTPYGWPQPPVRHRDPRLSFPAPGGPPMPHAPHDAPAPMHARQGSSDPNSPGRLFVRPEELLAQSQLLEGLCNTVVSGAEIERTEIMEKERFRLMIEQVARSVIAEYERNQNGFSDFPPESVQLKCFGSLASGFATKSSDMDLGLVSPLSQVQPDAPGSPIPRLVERAFLDIGLGARLLTQTRVPIIKICERPPEELRMALLAKRTEWETGVPEDGDEGEAHGSPALKPVDDAHAEPELQSPEEALTPEQTLREFKQKETASLPTYYGLVKRMLRKLGGRDITHSNVAEITTEDVKLLNLSCLAFVDGLADDQLRNRLLGYRSLNRYDLTSHSRNLRTLLGVFTQVEGEHMAMMWESRPFPEKDRARETAAENAMRSWRVLQDNPDYGRDPLYYQKELQVAADQLKRIPSVQMLLLSQSHNESAANYWARVQRLRRDLGASYQDPQHRVKLVLPSLIQHYIRGIRNDEVRDQVREFYEVHRVTNLELIGRRHKALQLAQEYVVCLEKGLYVGEAAATVRRYIELLRTPIAQSPSPGNAMIPLPPGLASLLSEIRLLGDPSRASPNQPRDRYNSALEFPKSGVGVQCDINFSAHLGVQNTLLLRCYSHCDPRVRPLVLFAKHWAKVRRINSPYRGTLGSYGYALMMLHYLVNVAQPFVLPNLQQLARPPPPNLTPQQIEETVLCKGKNIQFWRDEAEIQQLARDNALTQNREPVGSLLRGFFEYYAKGGAQMSTLPCRSFDWGRDVLSLRTHGGLLTKQEKGWTGARTVVEVQPAAAAAAAPPPINITPAPDPAMVGTPQPGQTSHSSQPGQPQPQQPSPPAVETKEIRNRYLFAIEDPFETDHNIARTVTHTGIVSIRDEFRRAWRIIKNVGRAATAIQKPSAAGDGDNGGSGEQQRGVGRMQQQLLQEDLLEDVGLAEEEREREGFVRLLEELHGVRLGEGSGEGKGVGEE